jgi:hypothetical protein
MSQLENHFQFFTNALLNYALQFSAIFFDRAVARFIGHNCALLQDHKCGFRMYLSAGFRDVQ